MTELTDEQFLYARRAYTQTEFIKEALVEATNFHEYIKSMPLDSIHENEKIRLSCISGMFIRKIIEANEKLQDNLLDLGNVPERHMSFEYREIKKDEDADCRALEAEQREEAQKTGKW